MAEVITNDLDEIYELAADMGGVGFVFTVTNDAAIMHNSDLISLDGLEEIKHERIKRVFYFLLLHVYILKITSSTLTTPTVPKIQHVLSHRTVTMFGKNCSAKFISYMFK